ncbi:MAG: class I SAM-dependent methyltransferase [Candidatus Omnitrophota bacterium]
MRLAKKTRYLFYKYLFKIKDIYRKKKLNKTRSVKELEAIVNYLESEVSRISSLVRYIATPRINDLPFIKRTNDSFDFQWKNIENNGYNLKNNNFLKQATNNVCRFTSLSCGWFKGKNILDVGCGSGRYSWALSKLGANVLSIDQSGYGIEKTKKACAEFKNHRAIQVDLLKPFQIDEKFDLVWCFGVLHHTGDAYGTFKKIASLVRPNGYLFVMIYGEPRPGVIEDYLTLNEYMYWRKKTYNMSLDERLNCVREVMKKRKFRICGEENIDGYFDAISPSINDLYSFEEIKQWFMLEDFCEIIRTVDARNHYIIAKKSTKARRV